jgi:glyoxylase-like metal-dependent hydrolase (beta-lactamase superfamily II)
MHVHHLNCGSMCPPFRRLVNGRGGLLERGTMVCHCLLVETRSGLVLVDTGMGTGDIRDPKRRLGPRFVGVTRPVLSVAETALEQVRGLGFREADVRHLVPTHLDLDHAGGFSDFPDAAIHVLDVEHAAAMSRRTVKEKGRYRPLQWSHDVKWDLRSQGGEKWFGFDAVRAVPGTDDEILLVPLFGHTLGHCGVAVRAGAGWILHAGDAYFAHDEIHGAAYSCPPGLALFQWFMQMDGPARLANQARLRELRASRRDVTIVCAHDAAEFEAAAAAAPPRLAATG